MIPKNLSSVVIAATDNIAEDVMSVITSVRKGKFLHNVIDTAQLSLKMNLIIMMDAYSDICKKTSRV
jgi:hypothetical protein